MKAPVTNHVVHDSSFNDTEVIVTTQNDSQSNSVMSQLNDRDEFIARNASFHISVRDKSSIFAAYISW